MSNAPDDDVRLPDASEKKPDVRVSTHRDLGVEVSRDLTENGRLARGDRSNMSRLSFSSRGRGRTELDPELQALREPEPDIPMSGKERRERAEAEQAAAAEVAAKEKAVADADLEVRAKAEAPGLLGKIARLFGGE